MSDVKHTAGPWAATTRRGSWDWLVYSVADPNIEICQPFHDGTEFNEIGEANAHLIAAAPDLLDALKTALAAWRSGEDGDNVLARMGSAMEAAIAKAEGRAP